MLKDRVQETSTTTGTGNLTLTNMPTGTGFIGFSTAFSTGAANIFFYVITQDANWEAGVAYMSDATTMVRADANVLAGSSGTGARVNFPAGTKYVFNTAPADRYTNWRGQLLQQPALQNYSEVITAVPGTTGTRSIDLSTGNVFTATKSGALTFTFDNVTTTANRAASFTLILTNGGLATGGAVVWPASVDWSYAIVPTLTAAGVDILTFMTVNNGGIWHGMLASADSR